MAEENISALDWPIHRAYTTDVALFQGTRVLEGIPIIGVAGVNMQLTVGGVIGRLSLNEAEELARILGSKRDFLKEILRSHFVDALQYYAEHGEVYPSYYRKLHHRLDGALKLSSHILLIVLISATHNEKGPLYRSDLDSILEKLGNAVSVRLRQLEEARAERRIAINKMKSVEALQRPRPKASIR